MFLLRIPQVAETLDCSEATVYRMVDDGTLPAWRVGRRSYRIKSTDVAALLGLDDLPEPGAGDEHRKAS